MQFQLARAEFIEEAKKTLQPIFARWGLEFRGLTIENQNIPEEFREAAAKKTLVHMDMEGEIEGAQSKVILAQLEAQKAYYLAEGELSKYQVIQQMGMDPLSLERAKVLETLARNPGRSLVDNRAGIMDRIPEVLPGGRPMSTPPVVPADPDDATSRGIPGAAGVFNSYTGTGPTSASASSMPSTSEASQTTGTMTREKVEQMLDKLDERFINGEISEQTYHMMRDRWQKKLA
jgi:hypothetical protein